MTGANTCTFPPACPCNAPQAGTAANSPHEDSGENGNDGEVEMARPRISKELDGRPIEERLGDLADALNEE